MITNYTCEICGLESEDREFMEQHEANHITKSDLVVDEIYWNSVKGQQDDEFPDRICIENKKTKMTVLYLKEQEDL